MFQQFGVEVDARVPANRLERLRVWLAERKLDAVLVPRADEHLGEYVPASAQRLKWLTGFTGSAGAAVVADGRAALFVDGRYTVQARGQVDTSSFEIVQAPPGSLKDWLLAHVPQKGKVGFDARLHSIADVERLTESLKARSIELCPLTINPIDQVWENRPTEPAGLLLPHPLEFAGRSAEQKIAELQQELKKQGQDAAILTQPDSIMWLFNVRGSDVAHTPIALSFAIVPAEGKPELFIASRKIGAEVAAHLATVCIVRAPEALVEALAALRAGGAKVRLDPERSSFWFASALGPDSLVRAQDPCVLAKARKNAVEIAGARAAHHRDGVAVARFLAWLDREAPAGNLDEITVARTLEAERTASNLLRDISFDTIAGSGPNAAIVHYRVNEASNRKLSSGELFLLDSGGQYADGTTDVTRTIAIGEPSEEMRQRFTVVLKAHIAIATARFPKGTRGVELDALARRHLWQHGLDFDHGTGHGVGSYLSVHEGPQSLSRRGMAELEPGMIVSNEPGYYKEGAYGIRIENLLVVTEPRTVPGGDREMMAFENLTLAPIDRTLVVAHMLSSEERRWLDDYHALVREKLSPDLAAGDRTWLEEATRPIAD